MWQMIPAAAANVALGMFNNQQNQANNSELIKKQEASALRIWNRTNYEAQRQHMENAGLNPGLLYGMGGAGGATTSGGGHGGAIPSQVHTGIDPVSLGLMKGQKENIQANTNKTNIEAAKTAGVDTELGKMQIAIGAQNIETLKQQVNSAKAQESLTKVETQLKEIEKRYQGETVEDRISQVEILTLRMENELRKIENETDISSATKDTMIKTINLSYASKLLEMESVRQGIDESKAKINLMSEQGKSLLAGIIQGYQQLETANKGINVNEQKLQLDKEIHDFNKLTGLPIDVIKTVIGAGILKGVFTPGRTVIQGFK